MRVKLVAGMEMRAGDKDCDFANGPRQCRRGGEDFDKLPDWAAEFRVMQPWVPWPDQSTVTAKGFKAFEIAFDTLSHVIIELALFGAEVGRGNEREAHQISPRSVCSGLVRSARAASLLRVRLETHPDCASRRVSSMMEAA